MIKSIRLDGAVVTAPIVSFDQSAGFVDVCVLSDAGEPIIENGLPKTTRLQGVVSLELDAATTASLMSNGG